MSDQIDSIIRNTARYHFEDGLNEILIGAMSVLGALVLWVPKDPIFALFLYGIGVVTIAYFHDRIKEKYTYLRSGYVLYREHKSRRWLTLLIVLGSIILVLGTVFLAFYLDYDHAMAWFSMIVGLFIGIVFVYKGFQLRLPRLALQGILSILWGIVLSPLVLSPEATQGYLGLNLFGLYFFLVGGGLTISGVLRFRKYLGETPPIAEADNER